MTFPPWVTCSGDSTSDGTGDGVFTACTGTILGERVNVTIPYLSSSGAGKKNGINHNVQWPSKTLAIDCVPAWAWLRILYWKVYSHIRHHFIRHYDSSNVHMDLLLAPYQQY